jgi:hypothetical protein
MTVEDDKWRFVHRRVVGCVLYRENKEHHLAGQAFVGVLHLHTCLFQGGRMSSSATLLVGQLDKELMSEIIDWGQTMQFVNVIDIENCNLILWKIC